MISPTGISLLIKETRNKQNDEKENVDTRVKFKGCEILCLTKEINLIGANKMKSRSGGYPGLVQAVLGVHLHHCFLWSLAPRPYAKRVIGLSGVGGPCLERLHPAPLVGGHLAEPLLPPLRPLLGQRVEPLLPPFLPLLGCGPIEPQGPLKGVGPRTHDLQGAPDLHVFVPPCRGEVCDRLAVARCPQIMACRLRRLFPEPLRAITALVRN